jgi:two-component system response regulator AlgR
MLNVILVDDEERCLQELAEQLKELGNVHVMATCTNGIGALIKAIVDKPDAMLIDVQMPGLNGIALAKRVLNLHNDIQIVLISEDNQVTVDPELAVVDYITKPVARERLVKMLRKLSS